MSSPIRIRCSYPHCTSKSGERGIGHPLCRGRLCSPCCHLATKVSSETGEALKECVAHTTEAESSASPPPKIILPRSIPGKKKPTDRQSETARTPSEQPAPQTSEPLPLPSTPKSSKRMTRSQNGKITIQPAPPKPIRPKPRKIKLAQPESSPPPSLPSSSDLSQCQSIDEPSPAKSHTRGKSSASLQGEEPAGESEKPAVADLEDRPPQDQKPIGATVVPTHPAPAPQVPPSPTKPVDQVKALTVVPIVVPTPRPIIPKADLSAPQPLVIPTVAEPIPPTPIAQEVQAPIVRKPEGNEEILKRHVTFIIWYKNGHEPLRIPLDIPSYPYFRFEELADVPDLYKLLNLSPSSYIDAYNRSLRHWEQHRLCTMRYIDRESRLLYRVRLSLIETLTDCPSLDTELALLDSVSETPEKRKRTNDHDSEHSSKRARTQLNGNSSQQPPTRDSPSPSIIPLQPRRPFTPTIFSSLTAQSHLRSSLPPGTAPSTRAPTPIQTPQSQTPAQSPTSLPNPNQPRPKIWPTNFTYHEVSNGLRYMDAILTASPNKPRSEIFEQIFKVPHVAPVETRMRSLLKRASKELSMQFSDNPRGGLWANFSRTALGNIPGRGESEGPAPGN